MTHHKIILTIAAVLALSACTDKNPVAPTLTIKVTPPADYSANETIHLVSTNSSLKPEWLPLQRSQ